MVDPITWSVVLLFVGFALVVLEFFLPSGGILGFLAVAAFVAAISLAYYNKGVLVGTTFLITTAVLVPVALAIAVNVWPHTPMGRRFLLSIPSEEDTLPNDEKSQQRKNLVGKVGVARSEMLPSGAIVIEGKTVDAVSQGMPIEAGQKVVVLEVKANRVVVRPAKREEIAQAPGTEDLLSQPLDAFGIDESDDPLA